MELKPGNRSHFITAATCLSHANSNMCVLQVHTEAQHTAKNCLPTLRETNKQKTHTNKQSPWYITPPPPPPTPHPPICESRMVQRTDSPFKLNFARTLHLRNCAAEDAHCDSHISMQVTLWRKVQMLIWLMAGRKTPFTINIKMAWKTCPL